MPPSVDWPENFERTPVEEREEYPYGFQVSAADAFDNIRTQLRRLGVDSHRISTAATTRDSPDPVPRSGEPSDPSVVVYYSKDGGDYAFPCDRWDNLRDNAQAIARYIEAKRALERYGVTTATTDEWETQIFSGGPTTARSTTERSQDRSASGDPTRATGGDRNGSSGPNCPNCGNDLSDYRTADFCPGCGTDLP